MFGIGKKKKIAVNVEKPGSLHLKISEKDKWTVSELTINGDIDGSDLLYLRDMAGYTMSGQKTKGNLGRLDLRHARFVPGGAKYARSLEGGCEIKRENTIPERAFRKCSKLKVVVLPENTVDIEGHAFERCSNLTSVTFNEALETIGERAFRKCGELKSLTFSANIKTIAKEAFAEDDKIGKITIASAKPPAIFINTFYGVANREVRLTVPVGATTTYKKNPSWRKFINVTEDNGLGE